MLKGLRQGGDREEISSPACQARVQKIMEYASSDIRFDVPLADACFEDRESFCSTVQPGSARVIRCLQSRWLSTPGQSCYGTYPDAPSTCWLPAGVPAVTARSQLPVPPGQGRIPRSSPVDGCSAASRPPCSCSS